MSTDLLPAVGTPSDFRRLGAMVILARYEIDTECPWNPEDVAYRLWENSDDLPFQGLAHAAMRAARDTGIKTPADIGRHIAAVTA